MLKLCWEAHDFRSMVSSIWAHTREKIDNTPRIPPPCPQDRIQTCRFYFLHLKKWTSKRCFWKFVGFFGKITYFRSMVSSEWAHTPEWNLWWPPPITLGRWMHTHTRSFTKLVFTEVNQKTFHFCTIFAFFLFKQSFKIQTGYDRLSHHACWTGAATFTMTGSELSGDSVSS